MGTSRAAVPQGMHAAHDMQRGVEQQAQEIKQCEGCGRLLLQAGVETRYCSRCEMKYIRKQYD